MKINNFLQLGLLASGVIELSYAFHVPKPIQRSTTKVHSTFAGPPSQPDTFKGDQLDSEEIWNKPSKVLIQGTTLQTWPIADNCKCVQLSISSNGRPLNSNVELWHGPDYMPSRMQVYIEDGYLRPFNALVFTPMSSNTLAVYNTRNMEFPCAAYVESDGQAQGLVMQPQRLMEQQRPELVQGQGAVRTWTYDVATSSVQIMLKTDGRDINARIELIQGPNNDKQVIDYYASDGKKRPFFAIIESPGIGNVVRITNLKPVEFPFSAWVAPYVVDPSIGASAPGGIMAGPN